MSSFFHRFKDHLRNFFRLKEEVPPAITGRKMEPLHPSSDRGAVRQIPESQRLRCCLKIRQVICVGTRVMHFGADDRVTKKVQQWFLCSFFD